MGRKSSTEMKERREAFRELLLENQSEAEIRCKLGLSSYVLQSLFCEASRNHWKELKTWNPIYEVYQKNELPSTLISKVGSACGIDELQDSDLIKAEKTEDGVKLTIISEISNS